MQMVTGIEVNSEAYFPKLREYCPRAFGTWAIFPQLLEISLTIDLDASHYLHNIWCIPTHNESDIVIIVCAAANTLRRLYSELTTSLDARIAAVHMYQRNALTLRELQSIQSLRDRPVEAAETLLNIVEQQPDAVYLAFLDVLKQTQQRHIYQRLVQDGCRGSWNFCVCQTKMNCQFIFKTRDTKVENRSV